MLLDDVRTALRGKSTAYDSDILILINTALYDLQRVGVRIVDPEEPEPEIKAAVITYAKAHFGNTEPARKDLYIRAYEAMRLNLALDVTKAGDD